eukprot:SAG31_NODE_4163_length_3520_cov_3.090032_5_plen_48_part_00
MVSQEVAVSVAEHAYDIGIARTMPGRGETVARFGKPAVPIQAVSSIW